MASVLNIAKAINIIAEYEEDAIFTAEHDQVWCGQGNGKSVTEITMEGKKILESLDWFIDENLGCWSLYV
jgi:hypothetical protein